MRATDPEVSDLITQVDPVTLARLPVVKQKLIDEFISLGNRQAARVVEAIPSRDGILDPASVDALYVRTHTEMQRMAEEFQHGQRVKELIAPLLRVLRERRQPPYRIVDIGCGSGYVIRWLAARARFSPDVELIGVDFNPALIAETQRLAHLENLNCSFLLADAFRLDHPAHIFLTTGVIHHFRGDALRAFFARHEQPEAQAFFHYDFQPGLLAPLGSWFWHRIRMRTALAQHDGVLSTVRAHTAQTLCEAARAGAPGFAIGMYGTRIWGTPIPRIFHTLAGLRPQLVADFRRALGLRAGRLGELR